MAECVQAELNQGGAWERLVMERDPFILTGLMWAWMEQLKEPVISVQAVKALNPENHDPQTVLNTLDQVRGNSVLIHICNNSNATIHYFDSALLVTSSQAPRQTLRCILDCMANLLMIPEEVENAFLKRTIKAFTWVRKTKTSNYFNS